LKKHKRRKHSCDKVKPDERLKFTCAVCSKRFKTLQAADKHGKTHSVEKPYKCHSCNMSFSQSESLEIHERIHMGEKRSRISASCVTKHLACVQI